MGNCEPGYKHCAKCGEIKPVERFSKYRNSSDGLQGYCKDCFSGLKKVYRDAKLDKYREAENKWKKTQKARQIRKLQKKRSPSERIRRRIRSRERALLIARTPADIRLKPSEWKRILNKYSNRCLCCGSTAKKITIDHVVPVSKGGLTTKENVQPLCFDCNLLKTDNEIDFRVTLFEFE